jgi:hypothetical protein
VRVIDGKCLSMLLCDSQENHLVKIWIKGLPPVIDGVLFQPVDNWQPRSMWSWKTVPYPNGLPPVACNQETGAYPNGIAESKHLELGVNWKQFLLALFLKEKF